MPLYDAFSIEENFHDIQKLSYGVIIQARMGSTRLRGKVLKEVLGRPLLMTLIRRLEKKIPKENIIVATTDREEDMPLVQLCTKHGILFYRGDAENVLLRMLEAAELYNKEYIVRVTGDCPLIDPKILYRGLCCFYTHAEKLDYLSNTLHRTFPRGMDFEIIRKESLIKAHKHAEEYYEKEHVTPYIIERPTLFRLGNFFQKKDLSSFRLTVDTIEDFSLIEAIMQHFGEKIDDVSCHEIVSFLEKHPELIVINQHIEQKDLR